MFVRLLTFLVRLVVLPLWAPIWLLRRRVPAGAWLHVTVEGRVVDYAQRRVLFSFAPAPTSIHGMDRLAEQIAKDPRIRGVLVTIRSFGGGMATATGFRAVLAKIAASGREVVVHLPLGGDTKELYVASAAHRVLVGPQSTLAPLGFASSTRYLKRALDKAGLEPQILSRGAFKSAGETLVRDSMSEPQKEQLGAILDQFYEEVVSALADGRKVDPERARAWVDGAPYRGSAATEAGLVDGVAYEDELPALLGSKEHPARILDAASYVSRQTTTLLPKLRAPSFVAIVAVHGTIRGGVRQAVAMDDRVMATVRLARMNPRVRAVVLHVNSPGGSALASDRMYHELLQLAREKPLVACFSDVAASGGYYVAAAAHHVVAQRTTITGSIGVISARVAADPLMERLGIVTESITRGARARLLDPMHRLSEDETRAIDTEIGGMYDAFVGIVAEGRKRERADIERVAQGRVWTGRDAQTHGLVDELGGLSAALAAARTRARLPDLAPVAVLRAPPWSRIPPLPLPRSAAATEEHLLGRVLGLFGMDLDLFHLLRGRERVLLLSELGRLFS